MKALYDTEEIKLTPRFQTALKELMDAQCEMMRENDPNFADCWTWGRCEIGDISKVNGIRFAFGGDESKPKGARFQISSANA